jgi:hypothetical protein
MHDLDMLIIVPVKTMKLTQKSTLQMVVALMSFLLQQTLVVIIPWLTRIIKCEDLRASKVASN